MSTLGEKLKHELRELIPLTVFFFGTFQLLALTQALRKSARRIASEQRQELARQEFWIIRILNFEYWRAMDSLEEKTTR